MEIKQTKVCGNCGEEYSPTGRCQKYCSNCKPAMDKKRLRENGLKRRAGGPGKGGNQRGEKNHQWRGGTSGFKKIKLESMNGEYFCERCGKDLRPFINGEKNGQWCVHHKDRDRSNPKLENLELLCKRCHQIEHKVWFNFLKSQDIVRHS